MPKNKFKNYAKKQKSMKLNIFITVFLYSILAIAQNYPNQKKYQSQANLSATILDETTQKPLPYINFSLKKKQGKIITGAMSDEKGKVFINKIPYGKYTLQIEFMGYETITKQLEFTSKKKFLKLGTIFIKEKTSDLEEVTVVAENSTIVQKIDRRVVNVGKDLTAVGTNASELLNNVPSLSVDPESGNVSMRGNENVRVLINGKPANMDVPTLLKTIPAASIKKIEMITNPSAKYNPEGMSGILNIILHKNARIGLNMNLTAGLTKGHHWRKNTSLNTNYKTGKVNFFANYSYNDRKSDMWSYLAQKIGNQTTKSNMKNTGIRFSHFFSGGMDFDFSEQLKIGFFVEQNFSKNNNNNNTIWLDKNGKETINTDIAQDQEGNMTNYDFSLDYHFDKEEKQKIEFSADYSENNSPRNAYFKDSIAKKANLSDNLRNYDEIRNLYRNQTFVNLDYTNEINDIHKLELGAEYRNDFVKVDNQTTQHTKLGADGKNLPVGKTRKRPDAAYDFRRNIYSAYVNYFGKYKKLLSQIGFRFEQYEADGVFRQDAEKADYRDRIFKIYPSAFLTYELNNANQIQMGYSLRVGRPEARDLNPIRRWASPKRIYRGNPNLKPEFTNSIETNYTRTLKKGSLTITGFYRNTQNRMTMVTEKDKNEEDALVIYDDNMDESHSFGFESNINCAITSWWRLNGFCNFYFNQLKGQADGEKLSVFVTYNGFRLNNNLRATKNLRFQVSGMFRGGRQRIQSYLRSVWRLDLGASWTILKGKGTINLRANDIFKGFSFKMDYQKPFESYRTFDFESRTVSLGFTYNFGKKFKKRRPKIRESGNNQM